MWNNLADIPGPTLAQGPLGALERLLVPLHCAGCGRADYHLCAACMRDFSGPPQQVEAVAAAGPDGAVRMVPVFSLAPYDLTWTTWGSFGVLGLCLCWSWVVWVWVLGN